IGYEYIELKNYSDVINNFRDKLAYFNSAKLIEAKGTASFSDTEFDRILIHVENKTVYESAKILRDKYILTLDNGKTVYLDFFSSNIERNIFQVSHQITMDKDHKDDVEYKNRYDVTVLINGLPLVQIELKRPGVEINEAINQINRYRKFSFKGIFRYLQLFVVSNSVQTKYFCNENEMDNGAYNPILKSLVFFWTDKDNKRINTLNEFTAEFFRKAAITEMLDKYMVIKVSEPTLMVMRPYQIYAVKAAKKRVLEANQNGFVFACTGSGKTLTSFKLAQLLRDEPSIDKVVFLIDRKDLDDQTVEEYNSFEKDCVDSSDSTYVLVKQLEQPDRGMIVTTIQKMANAVKSDKYSSLMEKYRDKKVIFIIDECHRSQFGKMHADVERHFNNANYIGFTGTPIFEANRGTAKLTTADLFNAGKKLDACLHKYMIKDAIADGNVLRFSVEYQRTIFAKNIALKGIDPEQIEDPEYCKRHNIDIDGLYHEDERIRKIAEDIFEHHEQHVHLGKDIYTALFAVDSIKTLGKYYDVFKELNEKRPSDKKYKVAAIFSYGANEDMDEVGDEHSAELLSRCMKDYNEMYGTSYDIDKYESYRKDIAKRMKQKNLPQVDILIVVNMMLTGFDAKPLNTLYLDKNLVWHSLVQAYSRTNRVDKATKQFGVVVSYRNIKKWQDDALRLFSGDGDPNEYLLENYEYYLQKWLNQVPVLKKITPTVDDAGQLQNEDEIRMFIIAFRTLVGTLATLKTFSKFDWKDLAVVMDEDEFEGYKSWYMYFRDESKNPKSKINVPVDVDFNIELVRTDRINVVYILNLLKAAKDGRNLKEEEIQANIDLILREIERSDNEALRAKADIMKAFIEQRFYDLPETADIQKAFEEFEKEQLQADIEKFSYDSELDLKIISALFTDYSFTGGISDESIRKRLETYGFGLLKLTKITKQIKEFITETYRKYKAEGE
ncbi:MAG: type I restriction endonuclease subunit R, partial [Lachnospiraceae bacterium]|nr:type I restriction endonuclease subunit R [Lachnospiraceae bacterium]